MYLLAAVAMLLAALPATMVAQAARVVGTITAINGNTLTVKTDAGQEKQVTVPAEASLKRLEPGQKDLSKAAAIQLSDLAVGDRVLVRLDANAATPQAAQVIAMKQSDVAMAQQKERDAWQRGVAGLVKSVDPASGTITVSTGAGPTAKNVAVKTTKFTALKRYAPGSIRFADAQNAPLSAIQAGDQLRARGTKNADGTDIAADEIVSGTFRNIAGTISQIDPAASTLVVKDLATKKQVTIHVAPDVQLRRIPERMAQMLAARLKGTGTVAAGGGQRNWNGGAGGGAQNPSGSTHGATGSGEGNGRSAGQNGGAAGGGMGGDPQRFLSMAPAIKLSELQKGEAVMVVTTGGANDVNAITLLAGVEPLLEAPAATDLLSNWSMGGGGAEAAAGTP
jgi:hypothetical protein